MTTYDDSLKAFDVFAGVLKTHRRAVAKHFTVSHTRAFIFDRMESASICRKSRLGRRIVDRYREDTGEVGEINWDRFKQWCEEHWKTILAVKVILTILFLFCI